jgi:hypothetical protein
MQEDRSTESIGIDRTADHETGTEPAGLPKSDIPAAVALVAASRRKGEMARVSTQKVLLFDIPQGAEIPDRGTERPSMGPADDGSSDTTRNWSLQRGTSPERAVEREAEWSRRVQDGEWTRAGTMSVESTSGLVSPIFMNSSLCDGIPEQERLQETRLTSMSDTSAAVPEPLRGAEAPGGKRVIRAAQQVGRVAECNLPWLALR